MPPDASQPADASLLQHALDGEDGSQPTDASLVQHALDGEAAAFATLFGRYHGAIRQFAYRVVLNEHAADDVAQESFITAARRLASLRDGQAFAAWLYRIAANVARNHVRSSRAHERKVAAAVAECADAGDAPSRDGRAEEALAAMDELPAKQREAVALVLLDNLSHAEAARRLGCAESTVSWRLFCAKRTLRRKLLP